MDANRITKILQIEGVATPGEDRPDRLERLQRENQRLEEQLAEAQTELTRLRGDNAKAVAAISYLQGQLLPLYNGLRAIFGQIDLVVGSEAPSAMPNMSQPRSNQNGKSGRRICPVGPPSSSTSCYYTRKCRSSSSWPPPTAGRTRSTP